jgi:hypothetical protein
MSSTAGSFSPVVYIECDVPAGMTLTEWRRRRDEERLTRVSRTGGVLRRLCRPGR